MTEMVAQNRAQRRNGARTPKVDISPTVAAQARSRPSTAPPEGAPLKLPGAGIAYTLDGATYHLARLTGAGVLEMQEYIRTGGIPSVDGETIGEQVVEGCFATGNLDPIHELLSRVTLEPIPPSAMYQSDPADLISTVNTLMDQPGLRWLARLVARLGTTAIETLENKMEPLMREMIDDFDIVRVRGTGGAADTWVTRDKVRPDDAVTEEVRSTSDADPVPAEAGR